VAKHVFVEKPLVLNVPDCERVLGVSEQHRDLVTMVGFTVVIGTAGKLLVDEHAAANRVVKSD
jgi:predicted dehydrogenase